MCVPDAAQRESGAPQIRDRFKYRSWNDPLSASHHFALSRFVLRRARDTAIRLP